MTALAETSVATRSGRWGNASIYDTRIAHVRHTPKRNAFSEANHLVDKFVVMHSGNIGLSQSLETVVEAAADDARA